MSIDLSGYSSVGVCQCVNIDIPEYGNLRLSTYHKPIMITEEDGNAYEYSAAGILLSISEGVSELRASAVETSIGLSGIPIEYAQGVQVVKLRGSRIDIRRVFTDAVTDQVLAITGNPVFMFRGIVSNYGFSETYNEFSSDSSLIINLSCSSLVDLLNTKITGRRTNDDSMTILYPGDTSFNRISKLIGKPFDFGAPIKSGQNQGTQSDASASQAVVAGSDDLSMYGPP